MSRSTTEETAVSESTDGTLARENWSLVLLFNSLALVGVVLSAGMLNAGLTGAAWGSSGVTVPFYVYLYASMGALGYIFTKLMTDIESFDQTSELGHLVELTMRIPLAWVLGAGMFLLANPLFAGAAPADTPAETSRFMAGIAFLVGLYVNVAMKSLGDIADRLLGRKQRS